MSGPAGRTAASRWHISNGGISYYKVKPDGDADKAAVGRLAGLGRRVWILVALAVLILVMLVAVIAINAADGGAPSSSLDTPTTSAVDPARA